MTSYKEKRAELEKIEIAFHQALSAYDEAEAACNEAANIYDKIVNSKNAPVKKNDWDKVKADRAVAIDEAEAVYNLAQTVFSEKYKIYHKVLAVYTKVLAKKRKGWK